MSEERRQAHKPHKPGNGKTKKFLYLEKFEDYTKKNTTHLLQLQNQVNRLRFKAWIMGTIIIGLGVWIYLK